MNPPFDDITSRIDEAPAWWQEGGVPRYGEFSPHRSSSIYAREVVLMEIACQSCDTRFTVCMASRIGKPQLAEQIKAGHLCYGDPPNTGCCPAGPSMNSIPIRIIEFWERPNALDWKRDAALEGPYAGWAA